jgi:transcriptional regulator with XRE-family HTH domain
MPRAKRGPSEVKQRPQVMRALRQEQQRLAARLRGMREERELTQEQAAERIGLSIIQYGRLERGQANVSLATLVGVAAAFRVRVAELFEG